jgi:hypothetical protein
VLCTANGPIIVCEGARVGGFQLKVLGG